MQRNDLIRSLREAVLAELPEPGRIDNRVFGTAITRFDRSVGSRQCFYRPMLLL